MDRAFYFISYDCGNEYKWVPLTNSPYSSHKLDFKYETEFLIYLRKQQHGNKKITDGYSILSIPVDKMALFEADCKEIGMEVEHIDLHTEYMSFMKGKTPIYKPSPQEYIPSEQQLKICCDSFLHIMNSEGTCQDVLEHNIAQKDSIMLYINSNELNEHHIPHCHVKYNKISNYCVLSLVDFEKLAPDGNIRNAVIKKAQELLKKNIQPARKKWNEIVSLMKFKYENGQYTSEYEKRN